MPVLEQIQMLYDCQRKEGSPQGTEQRPEPPLLIYVGSRWSSNCHIFEEVLASTEGLPAGIYVSVDLSPEGAKSFEVRFPSWKRLDESLTRPFLAYFNIHEVPTLLAVDRNGQQVSENLLAAVYEQYHVHTTLLPASSPEAISEKINEGLRLNDEGATEDALKIFSNVLLVSPSSASSNFNMAVLLGLCDWPRFSVDYVRKVIEEKPDDVTAHSYLSKVLYESEPELVKEAYKILVRKQPNNVRAVHQLAILAREGDSTRTAAPEYVKEVFDEMSDTFEEKLVKHLSYKIPWQLYEAVSSVASPASSDGRWTIVDLGCGTGLCGRIFAEYSSSKPLGGNGADSDSTFGHTIGVDLSPKMIEKTKEAGGYDELVVEDIHTTLGRLITRRTHVDLILSADTFIYVGELDKCFAQAQKVLEGGGGKVGGGYLAFSIELVGEAAAPDGFTLMRSGRYAHTENYIQRLSTQYGFVVALRMEVVVRTEEAVPIPGLVYVLRIIRD